MRIVGGLLIVLAIFAFLVASGMDTSVPTETGRRVHNIGLMRAQENVILVAVGLFIGGVILFALGGRRLDGVREIIDTEDSKKCPYCAETIKKEAILCRYCGKDLPPMDIGSGVISGEVGASGVVTGAQTVAAATAERYRDPSKLRFLCPNCDTDLVGDEAKCYKCDATLNAADGWRPVPKTS